MRILIAFMLAAFAVLADDDWPPVRDPGDPPFLCAPDPQCPAPFCAPDPFSDCECTCEAGG